MSLAVQTKGILLLALVYVVSLSPYYRRYFMYVNAELLVIRCRQGQKGDDFFCSSFNYYIQMIPSGRVITL